MAITLAKTEPAIHEAVRPLDSRGRLDSVDLLRGVVMVIMALDHVRDYFSYASVTDPVTLKTSFIDPVDLTQTAPALFLTRWVTHFCAPAFVFLAGTGAFLSGARNKSKAQLSWFLLSRGMWLFLLELTLVRLGWNFAFDYRHVVDGKVVWELGAGVIWVIGAAMMILSVLVFLPTPAVAAIGIAIIACHNLFDGISPEGFGSMGWLWVILHRGGRAQILPWLSFETGYLLLPWLGVMAAGYGLGAMLLVEPLRRRRNLLILGIALTLSFVTLRYANFYGDLRYPAPPNATGVDISERPGPWSQRENSGFTLLAFINCQKYPPSLLFLLMTLGPAITALAMFDRASGPIAQFFIVFGRVPLFYYLLHIPLIHALAVASDYQRFGWSPLSTEGFWGLKSEELPQGYGHSLFIVYLIWIGVILVLSPLCKWFAGVKRRRRDTWLSYL